MLLHSAIERIQTEGTSCIVIQNEAIVYTADGRGVSPLLTLYRQQPQLLLDAQVVDRVIGKAAAMILTAGGASFVYGKIMSISAREYLQMHGISTQYGSCVDAIAGRDGVGYCPIEQCVLEIDDPLAGIDAIGNRIEQLRQQTAGNNS